MQNVTVLGLGIMGGGIARNLLKAGYAVTVYNRTQAKAQPLLDAGAHWADSPHDAAANADAVISVVGDDTASRAMWLGQRGALGAMNAGAIGVEVSTLSMEWTRVLHTAAKSRGVKFVDAPVTGSKIAAASGTLTFLVGGDDETFAQVEPVLKVCSATIIHFGSPGAGAAFKLINTMQTVSAS